MGKPAARVGDLTSHCNTPLAPGTGCLTVLIGGLPAWRATFDQVVCPLVDGLKPHLGGVVAFGSTTVWIGGFPAARQGDQVVEAGAPNPIAKGEPTVLIG